MHGITRMDAAIQNHPCHNPDKLAAWKSATHTERPAGKSKTPEPPPRRRVASCPMAARYLRMSESSKFKWPRTSLALRRIAEAYLFDANRSDIQTEGGI
jgi:hypothetical protein